MIEVKRFSGKMNMDDSAYVLPPEDYIFAENITHDAVEGNQDSHVTNIVANRLVVNNYFGTFYNNDNFDFLASVFNNGNGTQKVSLTFDLGSEPITAIGMQYFDGVDWITFALRPEGSTDSFFSGNIPLGTYSYRVVLFYDTIPSEVYYDLTLVDGEDICIGAYANNLRSTIIFFNWNSLGYHVIYEYNNITRTIVPIFENLIDSNNIDVLGFTRNGKISSINIYNRDEGDLLFFIDSLFRPTFMAIDRMKAKAYVPVTRFLLDLAKRQPLVPPAIVYGNDTTRRVNYLRNRFFRFRYRWVYDDDFKSTYSPISEVLVPVNILNLEYNNDPTNNNIITLSLNSGDKDVKAIEIAMAYAEKSNIWVDFATVTTINKAEQGISDNTAFSYTFTNDSTYPIIPLPESDLLYDFIPLKAISQELLNGNVVGLAAITEGYNKDTDFDVSIIVERYEADSSSSGNLTGVVNITADNPDSQAFTITFNGIPAVGTTITLRVQQVNNSNIFIAATYTTISGDNATSITQAMKNSAIALGQVYTANAPANPGNILVIQANQPIGQPKRIFFSLEIAAPTNAAASNSIPSWKWSTQRSLGIAYFDQTGRTNGILYDANVIFPPYADTITGSILLPQLSVFIGNRPPIWAYSFQFFFTKENTYSIFWVTNDVLSDTNYIYFEVTGFVSNAEQFPTTTNVLTYTFQDGDRLRQIKAVGQNSFYSDTYDAQVLGYLDSPTINGVVYTGKRFLKINKVAPFSTNPYSQDNYIIEIYRPQQQPASEANKTFYEWGQQYDILNPATADRCHAGMLRDQNSTLTQTAWYVFKNGDWYFRIRTIALSQTGAAIFNVMDRNVVDTYISGVNSIDGRPNVIELNAREAFYGATIRHGQAYQPNTNINGLNRFYPQDYLDLDYSYGNIERIKTRDRFVRSFQTLKIGSIPLFNKIGKSLTGDEVVIQTNSLLNPVQYYVGDWGIGTARESLASFNFADYFTDNIKGAICRVSNNGVEPISILYKMNSWSNNELPLRKDGYFIYGCFEQRQNNYVIAIEETPASEAQTLTWDEEANRFDSFIKLHPEMMCALGVLFVGFKNGQLWTSDNEPFYNNFFGVQYDSSITGVFNKNVLDKKTFISITEVTSQVWDCPEIETTINSYGAVKQQSELIVSDFAELEGDFNASFLRDKNSQGNLINGDTLKGNWIKIKFRATNQQPPLNNIITLSVVNVASIDSPLNKR